MLAAAPGYLRRHGTPRALDDLTKHRCLSDGHTTTLPKWQLVRDGESISVPISAPLCCNNGDVAWRR